MGTDLQINMLPWCYSLCLKDQIEVFALPEIKTWLISIQLQQAHKKNYIHMFYNNRLTVRTNRPTFLLLKTEKSLVSMFFLLSFTSHFSTF